MTDERGALAEQVEAHRFHRGSCGLRADSRVAFGFTITSGKLLAIDLIADPERIRALGARILNDQAILSGNVRP